MVYNTQNYRVSGLCPSSGILYTRKHNFLETGSVSIFKWGEAAGVALPLPEDKQNQFPKSCFLVFRILDVGQSPETQ
jgi:hypothetical protein